MNSLMDVTAKVVAKMDAYSSPRSGGELGAVDRLTLNLRASEFANTISDGEAVRAESVAGREVAGYRSPGCTGRRQTYPGRVLGE